jgi:type III secretion protein T
MAVTPPSDVVSQVTPVFDVAARWLHSYAILLARPMAILSVNPIFTQTGMSNVLKGAIATGLIFPIWAPTTSALSSQVDTLPLTLTVIKEALIGLALGFPLGLPFWALVAAGDIIDQQRGATQGRLNDPSGFGDASMTGTLFLFCGIAILAATRQLDVIPQILYSSWRLWRPLDLLPVIQGPQTADLILHLLDALQAEALTLAAPVILAILLSDTMMLLLARIAPQLRVDDLSLAVRNLVFVIFIPLYAGFLLLYAAKTEKMLGSAFELLDSVLGHASGVTVP